MRGIMEDAIDRRLILIGRFAADFPAGVAVAIEAREVATGDLQADAVTRQKHIRRRPTSHPLLQSHMAPAFH